MIKNKLCRITAFMVAVIMALPYAASNNVCASTQPAVLNLGISSTPAGSNFQIRIEWANPGPQNPANSVDNAYNTPTTHPTYNNAKYFRVGAEGYNVEHKDATRNATGVWTVDSTTLDPEAVTSYTYSNFITSPGTLYSFRVVPWHWHPTYVNSQLISPATPATPPANQIREALFLSNITVEASGKNDEMTVIWDNPTYGTNQAFQSFKIYYARGQEDARTTVPITVSAAQCTRIPANPSTGAGPRLSYTISDPTRIYSGVYNVAVEPCDSSGQQLRQATGAIFTPTVTIGGETYPISFAPYATAYETRNATVALSLSLVEVGKDVVNLTWGNITYISNISKIAVFSSSDAANLQTVLSTYTNKNISDTLKPKPIVTLSSPFSTYYQLTSEALKEAAYYAIVVSFDVTNASNVTETNYIVSDIAFYIPAGFQITPNTPDIHVPPEPPTGVTDNSQIQLYWDAFVREKNEDGDTIAEIEIDSRTYTYDNAVIYDLYVADDMDAFTPPGINPITLGSQTLGNAVAHQKDKNDAGSPTVPSYTYTISAYTDINGQSKTFEKNKLYYIKLVAKKQTITTGGVIGYNESAPAYATFYIPAVGDISSPSMIRKPPLEIRKDSLGSDVITPSTLDVTWIEQWSEVYDYSPRDIGNYDPANNEPEWQTKAAKQGDTLYYGDDTKGKEDDLVEPGRPFHSVLNLVEVKEMLFGKSSDVGQVPARTLNITGSSYEAKVVLYSTFIEAMTQAGTLDKYLQNIMDNEPLGTNGWKTYVPERLDEEGKIVAPYIKVTGLSPNTTYAVFVRPYRMVNETPMLGYANFVAATTAPTPGILDITPTQPVVEAVTWTDTSAEIRWQNVKDIDYEIVYSTTYYRDIETQYGSGVQIAYDDVMKNSVVKNENGTDYRHLVITGLFPDTEYFFWVRARSKTNRLSFWSNPAYIKTIPLIKPDSPAGFGLVANDDLMLINEANGTEYTPRDKNYLIMEWLKDANDPITTGTGTSTGVAEILTEPTLIETYIAKFNGLISNKVYFFRARTIVTVTMDANRVTHTEYSYQVQICLDPDFVEMQEIYVPKEPTITNPYRQAESDWTRTIYYRTNTSDDDYDSDFDPDLVPLPDEDFEITFDGMTQTLTYRFRSGGRDAKGNYDNRVDQRFITRLVNSKAHSYNIDVTKYEDYVIKRRVVEVPYTLLQTFNERKIDFGIRAGDVTLILPPGTMETPLVKNIPDYGDNAKLHIIFDENPGSKPALGIKDAYASVPQDASLFLFTPTQYIKMPYAGVPLGVRLKLDNRYDLMDKSLGSYVKNEQTEGWNRVESAYDKENGQMEFNSQPGMYAIISKGVPDTVVFDQTTPSMLNVASKISITDMPVYNGNAIATSNQMLNLMDAILSGKSETAINKVPDLSAVSTIQKAGMKIGPDAATVSREQAIAAMVTLYEKKTKRQIKPTYTLADTPYRDTANAHAAYQSAMLKAAEIDMLNGKTALRPKDSITLGELFELADVIISDAGL